MRPEGGKYKGERKKGAQGGSHSAKPDEADGSSCWGGDPSLRETNAGKEAKSSKVTDRGVHPGAKQNQGAPSGLGSPLDERYSQGPTLLFGL
jgi:hypothetical protein